MVSPEEDESIPEELPRNSTTFEWKQKKLCKSNRILVILLTQYSQYLVTISRLSLQIHPYHFTSKWRASSINSLSSTHREPSSADSQQAGTFRQTANWKYDPVDWKRIPERANQHADSPLSRIQTPQTASPFAIKTTTEYITAFFRT